MPAVIAIKPQPRNQFMQTPQNAPHKFQVTCTSCNLRELCLPGGLCIDDLEQVQNIVYARRRVKRGDWPMVRIFLPILLAIIGAQFAAAPAGAQFGSIFGNNPPPRPPQSVPGGRQVPDEGPPPGLLPPGPPPQQQPQRLGTWP